MIHPPHKVESGVSGPGNALIAKSWTYPKGLREEVRNRVLAQGGQELFGWEHRDEPPSLWTALNPWPQVWQQPPNLLKWVKQSEVDLIFNAATNRPFRVHRFPLFPAPARPQVRLSANGDGPSIQHRNQS